MNLRRLFLRASVDSYSAERLVIALLISALVASLGMSVPLDGQAIDPIVTVGLFPLVYWFCLLAVGVLGVPLFILGRRLNLVRWWSSTLCGFFAGGAADLVMRFPNGPPAASELLRLAVIGGASGLTFWLVLRFPKDSPRQPGRSI